MWPPRRPPMKSAKDAEPEMPQIRMKARRLGNSFIENEAGEDKDVSDDESDKDNDLKDFIVVNNVNN